MSTAYRLVAPTTRQTTVSQNPNVASCDVFGAASLFQSGKASVLDRRI